MKLAPPWQSPIAEKASGALASPWQRFLALIFTEHDTTVATVATLKTASDAKAAGTRSASAPSAAAGVMVGGSVRRTVGVPGAAMGDLALASLDSLPQGFAISASVSAPGVVSAWIINHDGVVTTLPAGTLRARTEAI